MAISSFPKTLSLILLHKLDNANWLTVYRIMHDGSAYVLQDGAIRALLELLISQNDWRVLRLKPVVFHAAYEDETPLDMDIVESGSIFCRHPKGLSLIMQNRSNMGLHAFCCVIHKFLTIYALSVVITPLKLRRSLESALESHCMEDEQQSSVTQEQQSNSERAPQLSTTSSLQGGQA